MKRTLESFIKTMTLAAIVSSAGILHFQSNGLAQNIVDLSGFTDESTPYTGFIQVQDSTSAFFRGYAIYENLDLGGAVSTESNITYAISFTLQENPALSTDGSGQMTFGNTVVSLDAAFSPYQQDQYGLFHFQPVNFSFTVPATSAATLVSFGLVLDNQMSVQLSDVSITAVPEVSVLTVFLSGGCTLFLAQRLQNSSKRGRWNGRQRSSVGAGYSVHQSPTI